MRVAWCVVFVLAGFALAAGQDTNFPTGPQYLVTYGSPLFLHSIATPSMPWPSPPAIVGASEATSGLSAGAENSTTDTLPEPPRPVDLYSTYYGVAPVQEIRLQGYSAGTPVAQALPASILDVGTWQFADDLRAAGYGANLAETAAYWKTHSRHAVRAYGNGDVERLRQGN
jgi:hypothetical protein